MRIRMSIAGLVFGIASVMTIVLCGANALANLVPNGDFELWSGSVPADWFPPFYPNAIWQETGHVQSGTSAVGELWQARDYTWSVDRMLHSDTIPVSHNTLYNVAGYAHLKDLAYGVEPVYLGLYYTDAGGDFQAWWDTGALVWPGATNDYEPRTNTLLSGNAYDYVRVSIRTGVIGQEPPMTQFMAHIDNLSLTAVPEPGTMLLTASGLLGMLGLLRRVR
jgi:hypothetical protein